MSTKLYALPALPYQYDELMPVISEEQLRIHYEKHHNSYVVAANAIFEKFGKARQENADIDYKGEIKALSFNVGGHVLHSLFWENMAPQHKGGGNVTGEIGKKIDENFGGFERFKKEFNAVATGVEGSGWGSLAYMPDVDRLMCMAIEKHNVLMIPRMQLLLVVDVFEHAYYIDYKNDRGKFLDAFWDIINWEVVNERFKDAERKRR